MALRLFCRHLSCKSSILPPFASRIEIFQQNLPESSRNIAVSSLLPCLSLSTASDATNSWDSTAVDNKNTATSSEDTFMDAGFVPELVIQDLARAAEWNQGNDDTSNKAWDYEFCRHAVDQYERHLVFLQRRLQEFPKQKDEDVSLQDVLPSHLVGETQHLLSAETASKAIKAVLKCKLHTTELSKRVRELERLIGSIGKTPLTEQLSLRLVEANGKAGNIGRVLSLLNLRSARNYKANPREFVYAVQAIQSAGLYMRQGRNILLGDSHQPTIDNPTRWLDAILIHMHTRGIALTTAMANRMLDCYASTGRTSKAIHFFHYISRQAVIDPETLEYVPLSDEEYKEMPSFGKRRVKLKMKFRPPPNYYKVPSESKDKVVAMPGHKSRQTKLEFEQEANWSLPLTAAFSFADSLTHGACGHAPIVLDITSYNTLIKICCYRGALWRAMQILTTTMPQQGLEPNTITYNTILAGLARVGDTVTQKELFVTMNNKGVPISKFTIEAMVDGMLNMGDISGAISFVQDVFNQHSKLPPYTAHLKILEYALASDLPYEAERHVYLLQQIWRWEPNAYHDESTVREMELIQKNPKLSKLSIQKLFRFFGEELDEKDFF